MGTEDNKVMGQDRVTKRAAIVIALLEGDWGKRTCARGRGVRKVFTK